MTALERLGENSKSLLSKSSSPAASRHSEHENGDEQATVDEQGDEREQIKITIGGRTREKRIEMDDAFGPPLPPPAVDKAHDLTPTKPLMESTPRAKKAPKVFEGDPFDDAKIDLFDSFGTKAKKADSGPKEEERSKSRRQSLNPLTGRVTQKPKRSRFTDAKETEKTPPKRETSGSGKAKEKNAPSPVPKPMPKPTTPTPRDNDESLSLTLLCSPHVKKAVLPPTSSPYSTSVSMDSNSNSSSSSDSDSDSSTSKSDSDGKAPNQHPPPPPTRKNTSMDMQLHDDSGDDNYDPDNCLHTDTEEEAEILNDSKQSQISNRTKSSNSSGKFISLDKSGTSGSDLAGRTMPDETGMSDSSGSSNMVMSPVTPPTEEEDEKPLLIDTGSPQTAPPPVHAPPTQQPGLSPKDAKAPPPPPRDVATYPIAVVNPMASDTSPVSSGSNPQNAGNIPTEIPPQSRMQSVLTSQLSQSVPPVPPTQQTRQEVAPNSQTASGQSRPFSESIISIEGIAKALAPQRPTENSLHAEMVLRNLAELGKQISMNSMLTKVTAPVVDNVSKRAKEKSVSPSPSPETPPKKKSKRDKKHKAEKSDKKTFKKRKDFQRAVVNTAKEAIKPHYKSRKIDKTIYKKIMRELVRKVVNTSRTYTMDKGKVTRLVEKYVKRYSEGASGSKKKAEMLNYFNEESQGAKSDQSESPTGLQHLFAPGAPALTIPSLPLPPPPPKQPPPRQFGEKRQMF